MDYFSRRPPIALPTTEPYMSEKEPLTRSEFAAQPDPPTPRHKRSKLKKALIIVVHLFILSFVFRVVLHKLYRHHRHGHHRDPPDLVSHHYTPNEFEPFSFQDDFECSTSAEWSDPEEIPPRHHGEPPFSSDTSFTLSASSEALGFVARGSHSHGGIRFVEDDTDTLSSDEVIVDINVRYWNEEALKQAKVCTVSREAGEGVGIFTPTERHRARRQDELLFHISVRFPKSLKIKHLETSLPLFAHHFPKTDLSFNTLKVHGSNFPIFAESLVVDSGKIMTSNSAIRGNYTVTNILEIFTCNAPVHINVLMNNADKEDPTKLFVGTSNAPLESNISLVSTSSGGTGGEFVVKARTSNSPLGVKFLDSPVDSVLWLSAKTSNSPAFVQLHPAYEGTFDIKTSIFRPQISVDDDIEDPKGEGRNREVDFSTVGKEIKGSVSWVGGGDGDDDTEKKGHVKLATSILGAHLKL